MEPLRVNLAQGASEDSVSTAALRHCRVCSKPVSPGLTAREMMIGTRDPFEYLECDHCGCLQIDRIPSNLDRYYNDAYYTRNQRNRAGSVAAASRFRLRWTRFRLRSSRFARLLSGRRYAGFDWFRRTLTGTEDEILDVGCGSGRLLHRLHAEGFKRLTGIDVRLEKALQGGRAPVFERVSLEDHQGRYRLVMSHHSFEHLADPVGGFAAFARLVEPGGHLLLRLPIADCWAREHYRENWVQLDAPRHLHLHTRRSVGILAARAGFRVVHVSDDSGAFQIWGSELYRRDIALGEAGRNGRNALSVFARIVARIRARGLSRRGAGDQACFYLERLDDEGASEARESSAASR